MLSSLIKSKTLPFCSINCHLIVNFLIVELTTVIMKVNKILLLLIRIRLCFSLILFRLMNLVDVINILLMFLISLYYF